MPACRQASAVAAWVVPGEAKWTLVGLAEGAVGAKSIADHMQRSGRFDTDLGDNARVALRAENIRLKRENEILKKATVFFAKETK